MLSLFEVEILNTGRALIWRFFLLIRSLAGVVILTWTSFIDGSGCLVGVFWGFAEGFFGLEDWNGLRMNYRFLNLR